MKYFLAGRIYGKRKLFAKHHRRIEGQEVRDLQGPCPNGQCQPGQSLFIHETGRGSKTPGDHDIRFRVEDPERAWAQAPHTGTARGHHPPPGAQCSCGKGRRGRQRGHPCLCPGRRGPGLRSGRKRPSGHHPRPSGIRHAVRFRPAGQRGQHGLDHQKRGRRRRHPPEFRLRFRGSLRRAPAI